MRPDISVMVFQFFHGGIQIHEILIAEEPMVTDTLGARTVGDVPGIAFNVRDLRPVLFQSLCDQLRGVVLGWLFRPRFVLRKIFHRRKIFHELLDQLFLLSRGRSIIGKDFHALAGADVVQISVRAFRTSGFDVAAPDDQSCHSSSSFLLRTCCSSES